MRDPIIKQILEIFRQLKVVRPKDLAARGIPPVYLQRLCQSGEVIRASRGIYHTKKHEPSSRHLLALMAKRIPKAVVCLLSALELHDLTTHSPHKIWIAIHKRSRRPVDSDLPIRIVRFSETSLTAGVEEVSIEGIQVKVTSVAKTIADCFKFRRKIGEDIAIEALRDGLKKRKCTRDEIWKQSKICRVANVIRPYMESIG
ncbi:MAG: type IV toxin-antitoxin system AbiEi family antitoxin domain-containing protein [Verrucomicrobiota bacterium]